MLKVLFNTEFGIAYVLWIYVILNLFLFFNHYYLVLDGHCLSIVGAVRKDLFVWFLNVPVRN